MSFATSGRSGRSGRSVVVLALPRYNCAALFPPSLHADAVTSVASRIRRVELVLSVVGMTLSTVSSARLLPVAGRAVSPSSPSTHFRRPASSLHALPYWTREA
jgi:hypothetical protein